MRAGILAAFEKSDCFNVSIDVGRELHAQLHRACIALGCYRRSGAVIPKAEIAGAGGGSGESEVTRYGRIPRRVLTSGPIVIQGARIQAGQLL